MVVTIYVSKFFYPDQPQKPDLCSFVLGEEGKYLWICEERGEFVVVFFFLFVRLIKLTIATRARSKNEFQLIIMGHLGYASYLIFSGQQSELLNSPLRIYYIIYSVRRGIRSALLDPTLLWYDVITAVAENDN